MTSMNNNSTDNRFLYIHMLGVWKKFDNIRKIIFDKNSHTDIKIHAISVLLLKDELKDDDIEILINFNNGLLSNDESQSFCLNTNRYLCDEVYRDINLFQKRGLESQANLATIFLNMINDSKFDRYNGKTISVFVLPNTQKILYFVSDTYQTCLDVGCKLSNYNMYIRGLPKHSSEHAGLIILNNRSYLN